MASRSTSFWIFIATLVLLHYTLHLALGLGDVVPDLLTVAALLGARRLAAPRAALLGLALGVLEDGLAVTGFGASAVALVAVCYFGSRTRAFFEGESYLFLTMYIFVGKWLRDALWMLMTGAFMQGGAWGMLFTDVVAQAVFAVAAAVVALLLYRLVTGYR